MGQLDRVRSKDETTVYRQIELRLKSRAKKVFNNEEEFGMIPNKRVKGNGY